MFFAAEKYSRSPHRASGRPLRKGDELLRWGANLNGFAPWGRGRWPPFSNKAGNLRSEKATKALEVAGGHLDGGALPAFHADIEDESESPRLAS